MVTVSLLAAICSSVACADLGPQEADPSLVPLPAQVRWVDGSFQLRRDARVVWDDELRDAGELLAAELGLRSARSEPAGRQSGDVLVIRPPDAVDLGPEGYTLSVTAEQVRIGADTPAGAFWGTRTLLQLVPTGNGTVPCVEIRDRPRFGWRGLMLDCSRTFQSLDYLRATIDRLAAYKLNVLHLHLTDDQGWRLEISRYPRLTQQGARFPEKYGEPDANHGYYRRDELRPLIRYAERRHVTIVPEIEMPGHSLAALSCYPELSCSGGPFEIYPFFKGPGITKDIYCAGSDATFEFLENVLDEVVDLFPSRYIHIGGDEAPKDQWEKCPRCQARIRAEGLANEHELQSWFIRRIESMVHARGRRLIGWDEILEGGLAPRAAVMSWRGVAGGVSAAAMGHEVVMSPTSHCYLDYDHGRISARHAYEFEPIPPELGGPAAGLVLGLQGNFWSHIDRTPDGADRQIWPRMLSLAERAWSRASVRDWGAFRARLSAQRTRLDSLGIAYHRPSLIEPVARWSPSTTPAEFEVIEWDVSTAVSESGPLQVLFQFRRGAHRLEIEWVELVAGATSVSRDEHLGYTGARDVDNVYALDSPELEPGVGLLLRARVRGGGGTDSSGEVFLLPR